MVAQIESPAAQVDCPRIVSLASVPATARNAAMVQVAQIFFETSSTKAFASPSDKNRFFMRWCGSYADLSPEAFLLAKHRDEVVGYIAGCLDTFSAASEAITRDIFYYTPAGRSILRSYPSHFHINMRPVHQGRGLGRQLVEHFAGLCRNTGSSGVHAVTGASSPAVKFYEACGFRQMLPTPEFSETLAILTRPL